MMEEVTQEERERAIQRSRRMYQMDYQSDMATVWDRGVTDGKRAGSLRVKMGIACCLLSEGASVDKAVRYTGLPCDRVQWMNEQLIKRPQFYNYKIELDEDEEQLTIRRRQEMYDSDHWLDLASMWDAGFAEGKHAGELQGKAEAASCMLTEGEVMDEIMRYTGLSQTEIEEQPSFEVDRSKLETAFYRIQKIDRTGSQLDLMAMWDKGKTDGRYAVARNLVKMGLPLEQIVEATGFPQEIVERLVERLRE